MRKRNERGFTLMELMVVIVIVAILAAVAVPLYINYVKDARRTEAKGAIAAIISAEQIYYQRYNQYTADAAVLKVDEIAAEAMQRGWTFALAATDVAAGFEVTADNTTDDDLSLTCTYTRATGALWSDEPPPPDAAP